jgi:hypothetical protein
VSRIAAQAANDPRNMLRFCGDCHNQTEHGETWQETEGLGWRIPKWVDNPYAIPALLRTVNYAGTHWFLLDQDGGYTWLDPQDPPPLQEARWVTGPPDPLDVGGSTPSALASRLRITYAAT